VVYTLAAWTVLHGREEEFVALWGELAEWTLTRFPTAQGTLLRDRERPNRFVSFGPWESLELIQEWRSSPEWQEIVSRIRSLLEDFEPGAYDVVLST